MKYILPILVMQALAPGDTNPYVSLINLYETEAPAFVNPISNDVDGPVTYEEIREQAIINCRNVKNVSLASEGIINDLIEIEKQYSVPASLRGMLLAAACKESGYNPNAKGDHKFSKSKRKPMALGILQMWPWWENKKRGYGIDRSDHVAAAHAWMQHIIKRLPKVKSLCRYKTPERRWVAAWVTAIRAPKADGRCREKPLHLSLLKKWHRLIKVERNFVPGC